MIGRIAMRGRLLALAVAAFAGYVAGCNPPAAPPAAPPPPVTFPIADVENEKAIRLLGGSVIRDQTFKETPIIKAYLGSKATDADIKYVRGLKHLQELQLG